MQVPPQQQQQIWSFFSMEATQILIQSKFYSQTMLPNITPSHSVFNQLKYMRNNSLLPYCYWYPAAAHI